MLKLDLFFNLPSYVLVTGDSNKYSLVKYAGSWLELLYPEVENPSESAVGVTGLSFGFRYLVPPLWTSVYPGVITLGDEKSLDDLTTGVGVEKVEDRSGVSA